MSGVVIGLVVLILLVVIGAVIYFSTSEEVVQEVPRVTVPDVSVDDEDESEAEVEEEFSIVNGWIHESKYGKMLKVANDGALIATGYNKNDNGAKWSFDPTDKSGYYYIVSSGGSPYPGKVLRITSSVIQTTTSKDATSRIKLNPSGDGYKISDRTGRNYVKIQGSQILSVKEDEASVFNIEPSQFYISLEKTAATGASPIEGFTGNTTMVLSEHDISCEGGGVTSLDLKNVNGEYNYEYKCMKGIDTTGDVVSKINDETSAMAGQVGALEGQPIDCGDKMIKSAQLLYQDLENEGKIAYSYSCLPTPLDMSKCENKSSNPSAVSDNIDALIGANVSCPSGKGITQIKYVKDDNNDIRYDYKCCPPA